MRDVVEPADVLAAVVADAQRRDPSLEPGAAALLAAEAIRSGSRDAAEIARVLLAHDGSADVSWVNAVAAAVAGLDVV